MSQTFPLDLPRGLRASWVYLDDEKKQTYFRWRGVRSAEDHVLATGSDAYFTIPPIVRYHVGRIWKHCRNDGVPFFEGVDFDHLVPRNAGGPGIFAENVVPCEPAINRAKRDDIPLALVEVARRHGLASEAEATSWTASARKEHQRVQLDIARRVTGTVRNRLPDFQRRFYFEVLCEAYTDVRRLFEAAGAAPS